ncbi:putative sodium-coupled neutral amino acid transporter 7 [Caerostris extrusa]|uniref:Sodium-coupled neutral amino acid transporter 7 n=1 Tax=Caerostris extrusa TaxID=172846 RepID=A0AAV4QR19_CAEEX|nr:putative sodium-coupled neutral amino acid transporter 7 [Caerostris extrusa]
MNRHDKYARPQSFILDRGRGGRSWKCTDLPLGSIGIFVMLYPVFLTVYGYFKITPSNVIIKTRPTDLSEMFSVFPVLGLGYQCQEVVVPVYSCMRERNLWQFTKASVLAMAALMAVYFVTGCFGYLTFGAHVAHNVMKMYDAQDPFVMVGVAALIVKMVATYPILALCGRAYTRSLSKSCDYSSHHLLPLIRDAAAGIYAELRGLKPTEFAATEKGRRYVVAAVWFASSLLLAVFTQSIGVVIKYLGSVASANIFIYPGICLLQMVLKLDPDMNRRRSHYLIAYAILITGIGAFCVGVVLFEAILSRGGETRVDLCHLSLNTTLSS